MTGPGSRRPSRGISGPWGLLSHLPVERCPVAVCPTRPSQPFLLLLWCRRLGVKTQSSLCCPCRESSTAERPSPSSPSPAIISKHFETCLSESLVHSGVPHRSLYFLPLLLGDPWGCVFSSCLSPETSGRDSQAGRATCSCCRVLQRYKGGGDVSPQSSHRRICPITDVCSSLSPWGPLVPFACVVPIPFYPYSLHSPINRLLKVLQTSLDEFT